MAKNTWAVMYKSNKREHNETVFVQWPNKPTLEGAAILATELLLGAKYASIEISPKDKCPTLTLLAFHGFEILTVEEHGGAIEAHEGELF